MILFLNLCNVVIAIPVKLCFIVFFTSFLCSLNVQCGKSEERWLLTGLHAVADIQCRSCKTVLGWKYVSVYACFQVESNSKHLNHPIAM